MLRKISFILASLGIAFLLALLIIPGEELGDRDIDNMMVNEKVFLEGKVESERDFGNFKIWKINGKDFEVVCDCEESYLNKEVQIIGLVDEFNEEKQVRVLEITEIRKVFK